MQQPNVPSPHADGPNEAWLRRHMVDAQKASRVGSWELTIPTEHVWMSDQLCKIFDVEPGTIHSLEAFAATRPPERRAFFLEHMADCIRLGVPLAYDSPVFPREGGVRWTRGRGAVHFDEEGRMVRMIGTVEDITELKAAEEEIARKTAALEAANAALTEQTRLLERQHEELQRLDRMKDEFLSVVSHELRTPLATIEGVLSLLERPGVDVDAYHRRIGIATRTLTSLVSDLLSAAQLRAGRFELTSRPYQPDGLLEEAFEEVEPVAAAKGVRLRREVHGVLPTMVGDHYRLLQVLRNLLMNAVRHTDQAGEVCLSARLDGGQLLIEVADTGEGIDEAARARLFERFGTSRGDGVGLGLFVVKELVEAHGGRVIVDSERGVGSTFTVALPLS